MYVDFKEDHLLVPSRGRLKLIDFGSAIKTGDKPLTCNRMHASPEVLRRQPLDERSDLFSVGSLLYALVEGKVYDPLDVKQSRFPRHRRFSLRDEVPKPLADTIRSLVELCPERRCSSASALREQLEACAQPMEET